MIKQLNGYLSGFNLLKIYFEGQQIFISERFGSTAKWSKKRQPSTEDYQQISKFLNNDALKIIDNWQAQALFVAAADFKKTADISTTTPWGGRYSQKDAHYWYERQHKFARDMVIVNNELVGLQIISDDKTVVLIAPGFEDETVLHQWRVQHLFNLEPKAITTTTTMVPMTDGIELATDIILPREGHTPNATILIRTPYNRENYVDKYAIFAKHGYSVVVQDVRGRNQSQGNWQLFRHETEDGNDTLNWIADQPWSNGSIGMIGGSYLGYVQWAAAVNNNPHLKAIVSLVTAGGPFTDALRKGGSLVSALLPLMFAWKDKHFEPTQMVRKDWTALLDHRPIQEIPLLALGKELPYLNEILAHDRDDGFYTPMDWYAKRQAIHVPAFIQSGWFDDDGVGTTEAIRATNDYEKGQRQIVLGPWLHGGNAQYDLGGYVLGPNALRPEMDLKHLQWFDHFLKGYDNGIEVQPTVTYYRLNADQWISQEAFNLDEHQEKLYLDAKKQTLLQQAPDSESIKYNFDSNEPTPYLADLSSNEAAFVADYAAVEKRQDLVCFTSPVLKQSRAIAGVFTVGIYAASSAVDTDWVVRLTDVYPDGRSIALADGVLNGRFRAKDWAHPEYLEPEKRYYFEIETSKVAALIKAGHALRLEIASGAKNLLFTNSNTKAGFNGTKSQIAHQTIYTGKNQLSFVAVPWVN
ncbi:CocE/NonD family hydrolase [Lactobacillus sp. CC-MHH1034]|uniref:CocE/NonD family hydrolase n=1 Tax=Agrilactobacillus fermenti TaxID=2586909 RepID=UPI001E43FA90|nr:CocE/NonD family hydrolase [Agrilactobacillus fermenti]MCD2257046.1 CocE/NonD family hydrolase [Agrilactobacillus fermenti]